jgi:hypothetical protein
LLEAKQIFGGSDQQLGIVLQKSDRLIAFGAEQPPSDICRVMMIDSERFNIPSIDDGFGLTANGTHAILRNQHVGVLTDSHAIATSERMGAFFLIRNSLAVMLAHSFKTFRVSLHKMGDSHFGFAFFAMIVVIAARRLASAFRTTSYGSFPGCFKQMFTGAAIKFWLSYEWLSLKCERLASHSLSFQSALVMFQIRAARRFFGASATSPVVGFPDLFKNVEFVPTIRLCGFHADYSNALNVAVQ